MGTISPASGQAVYQTASQGAQSVTFSETPAKGYQFSGWGLVGVTSQSLGNSSSVTVTYAEASAVLGGNTGQVSLVANFGDQPTVVVADSIANPGKVTVTTTGCPGVSSFGSCQVPVGTVITVSASSVPSGCNCSWKGWIANGQVVTTATTYTFTVSSSVSLMPNVVTNALVGGGNGGGGNGSSGSGSSSFGAVSIVLIVAGALVTGFGVTRKNRG